MWLYSSSRNDLHKSSLWPSLVESAMSFDAPPQPQIPNAPPPPPMYGERQAGKKQRPKGQQTTFLGADAVPDMSQVGNKTLLGS